MYRLMRPLLFSIPAERSHSFALQALRTFGALPGPVRPAPGRPRRLMGLVFPNVVGLAAGLDKDAIAAPGLARLGFGHLELGAVTPRPQPGNPKPRLFRLQAQQALINRMGFNNAGAAAMAARLGRLRASGRLGEIPIGVNIGKNRDTPVRKAAADYRKCMDALHGCVDYLTVNLSSPNTPGLRGLQQVPMLRDLLDALKERQARLAQGDGRYVPLCVKLAPDLDDAAVEAIAEILLHMQVDGVVATNTTLTRPAAATPPQHGGEPLHRTPIPALTRPAAEPPQPRANPNDELGRQDQAKDAPVRQAQATDLSPKSKVKHGNEAGGLSGAPLAPLARRTVLRLRRRLGPEMPIIAVGGILSAADAAAMFKAGANLVQIYTGLIYQGPALIRAIAQSDGAWTQRGKPP